MTQTWRWQVFYANLDPVLGSEQAGTRPVLVVSEEDFNQVMQLVTVLPLTSRKPGRHVYPNEVLVRRGTAGLAFDSIVLAHQVRTITKQRVKSEIGSLDDSSIKEQVLEAIKDHFGID